jgi:hypothetical protein
MEVDVMSDVFLPADAPLTPEDESSLTSILAEMSTLRIRINADQQDTDRLKEECRVLKAETRALIDTLRASVLPC